jgi:hypothetical protein
MSYRIKQFFWGITAQIDENDKSFINMYLSEAERECFYSLPKYEQAHSLRVAREVLKESLENSLYDIMLIKAALLHDIGKANSGLNIITKSIFVILDKLFPKLLKRFTSVDIINAYYYHPEIAVTVLRDEDDYVKYLIKNHHNYDMKHDEKLIILQKADTIN